MKVYTEKDIAPDIRDSHIFEYLTKHLPPYETMQVSCALYDNVSVNSFSKLDDMFADLLSKEAVEGGSGSVE